MPRRPRLDDDIETAAHQPGEHVVILDHDPGGNRFTQQPFQSGEDGKQDQPRKLQRAVGRG